MEASLSNPLSDPDPNAFKFYLGKILSGRYIGFYVGVSTYVKGKRGRNAKKVMGYYCQLEDPKGFEGDIIPDRDDWSVNSREELKDVLTEIGEIRWMNGREYADVYQVLWGSPGSRAERYSRSHLNICPDPES